MRMFKLGPTKWVRLDMVTEVFQVWETDNQPDDWHRVFVVYLVTGREIEVTPSDASQLGFADWRKLMDMLISQIDETLIANDIHDAVMKLGERVERHRHPADASQ